MRLLDARWAFLRHFPREIKVDYEIDAQTNIFQG